MSVINFEKLPVIIIQIFLLLPSLSLSLFFSAYVKPFVIFHSSWIFCSIVCIIFFSFHVSFQSFYWHILSSGVSSLLMSPLKTFFSFLLLCFWLLVFPFDSYLEFLSICLITHLFFHLSALSIRALYMLIRICLKFPLRQFQDLWHIWVLFWCLNCLFRLCFPCLLECHNFCWTPDMVHLRTEVSWPSMRGVMLIWLGVWDVFTDGCAYWYQRCPSPLAPLFFLPSFLWASLSSPSCVSTSRRFWVCVLQLLQLS